MKKWFFALITACVILSPVQALAATETTTLVIDPEVTQFSNFTVSPNMQKLTGEISLNGNVPDAENKMRPVYKFTLENNTTETLSGLTANIPYPPNTQLDTSYPPEVLITETNMNRNKEDVIDTYDTTTGIHLTLPNLEPGEILTFDVKFFLLPTETQDTIDMNKVTIASDSHVERLNEKLLNIKWTMMIKNANSRALENVMLKAKLPEGVTVEEATISGLEGATVEVKDGYMYILLPSLNAGDSNLILNFNCHCPKELDTLQFPFLMHMDGMTDINLTPLSVHLKDASMIDWTKITAAGKLLAEMKNNKLYLDYMLTLTNSNQMALQNYKVRILLPETVKVSDLNVSGVEGSSIEMDKEGVVWITIPSLKTGSTNLHVRLMGMMSGSNASITSGIMMAGAEGVTTSLTTDVKGNSSTDQDSTQVITDVTDTNQASGNTLPKTGSPLNSATWTMLGSLFILLGIGLYRKAVRMNA